MIRDYQAFLARRWNELDMPAKIRAVADNEDAQRPVQVSWLIQAVGELRHTTMHEGRQHPDVGLLFKETGNHFDAGNGLKIANDIICVRDTNQAGEVTDPRIFAIVDCVISVNRHTAHPGWIVNGMAVGADVARFRDAPVPATAPQPVTPGSTTGTGIAPATGAGTGTADGGRPPAAADADSARALAQIATLLQEMRAGQEVDRELQQKILATLEALRRDLDNTGRLLAALAGGGGLGNIADLFKR